MLERQPKCALEETAWLVIQGVSPSSWSYSLSQEPQTIGRDHLCEIVLHHPKVSRRHARIWQDGQAFRVEDLNSRNGTKILDGSAENQRLPFGTTLHIGELTLSVIAGSQLEQCSSPSTIESLDASYLSEKGLGSISLAQLRVLRKLLDGLSEAEIAKTLFLSPTTVHTHAKAIYKSINVQSRAELLSKFIDPSVLKTLERFRPRK
jgi:DNA-binding CsgD family transcriptional regulator